MTDYHATDKQILTFWKMLADRKWHDLHELIGSKTPRANYLMYIEHAYRALQANGYVVKQEMSKVLDDLACFKGWSIEQRLRDANRAAAR